MFQDIDRLIEFGVQMGAIVTLIGVLAAWLKRSVNRGMVTSQDFEEAIHNAKKSAREYTDKELAELKTYTNEKDEANKKWLRDLKDDVKANGRLASEANAKIDVVIKSG